MTRGGIARLRRALHKVPSVTRPDWLDSNLHDVSASEAWRACKEYRLAAGQNFWPAVDNLLFTQASQRLRRASFLGDLLQAAASSRALLSARRQESVADSPSNACLPVSSS